MSGWRARGGLAAAAWARAAAASLALTVSLLGAGCAALTEVVGGVAGGVQQVAGGVQQVAQGVLAPAPAPMAVLEVEIAAPPALRAVLERHLDLVRLARLARGESVGDTELDRLMKPRPRRCGSWRRPKAISSPSPVSLALRLSALAGL